MKTKDEKKDKIININSKKKPRAKDEKDYGKMLIDMIMEEFK